MAHDIVIDQQEKNGQLIVTSVGFQGYNQLPLLMVYREYRDLLTGVTDFAEVLYQYDKEHFQDQHEYLSDADMDLMHDDLDKAFEHQKNWCRILPRKEKR